MAGFSSDGVTLDCHSSSFLSSPLHGLPWSLENLVPVRVVGDVRLENLVRALVADGACLKILVPARVTGEGCLKSLVRVRIPGGPTNMSTGEAKHSASKSMRAPTRLSIGGLEVCASSGEVKRLVPQITPTRVDCRDAYPRRLWRRCVDERVANATVALLGGAHGRGATGLRPCLRAPASASRGYRSSSSACELV